MACRSEQQGTSTAGGERSMPERIRAGRACAVAVGSGKAATQGAQVRAATQQATQYQ